MHRTLRLAAVFVSSAVRCAVTPTSMWDDAAAHSPRAATPPSNPDQLTLQCLSSPLFRGGVHSLGSLLSSESAAVTIPAVGAPAVVDSDAVVQRLHTAFGRPPLLAAALSSVFAAAERALVTVVLHHIGAVCSVAVRQWCIAPATGGGDESGPGIGTAAQDGMRGQWGIVLDPRQCMARVAVSCSLTVY